MCRQTIPVAAYSANPKAPLLFRSDITAKTLTFRLHLTDITFVFTFHYYYYLLFLILRQLEEYLPFSFLYAVFTIIYFKQTMLLRYEYCCVQYNGM